MVHLNDWIPYTGVLFMLQALVNNFWTFECMQLWLACCLSQIVKPIRTLFSGLYHVSGVESWSLLYFKGFSLGTPVFLPHQNQGKSKWGLGGWMEIGTSVLYPILVTYVAKYNKSKSRIRTHSTQWVIHYCDVTSCFLFLGRTWVVIVCTESFPETRTKQEKNSLDLDGNRTRDLGNT